jgi:2,3-dihydroxy-p-cumate/2,3-dihydroxybenzoate 3,4-dioxygenase
MSRRACSVPVMPSSARWNACKEVTTLVAAVQLGGTLRSLNSCRVLACRQLVPSSPAEHRGDGMDRIKQLGYQTMGVANLNEGIEFYTRVARLTLVDRRGSTAFLAGGLQHHWIKLEEGSTRGVRRVALEVTNEEALRAIRGDLAAQGIEITEGGDMSTDKVKQWLRFADPSGTQIELFLTMEQRPVPPPSPGVNIEKFLHAGLEVPNYGATLAFYRQTLGFRPSDYIADKVAFLRCGDGYHHSLVLIRSGNSTPAFNHFCIQVQAHDDVMRFRNNAVKNGAPLRDDLLRHAPSGSVGVYVKDEARGLAVEYCYDHPTLSEDHVPGVLPLAVDTVDVWRSALPEPRMPALDATKGKLSLADPPVAETTAGTSPAFALVAGNES